MGDGEILRDSCAVFGCATTEECANYTSISDVLYLGLIALQHRGQESSGMVISDGKEFHIKKGMGMVSSVYDKTTLEVSGNVGIGHNRYSTAGSSNLHSCQPFVVHTSHGQIAVAHNGELVNADKIRNRLLKHGIGLSTKSDSELITQLLVSGPPMGEPEGVDWSARIVNLMKLVQCSYSVVLLTQQNEIYAFRDPFGNRPLCLGEINLTYSVDKGDSKKSCQSGTMYVVSSESCAFTSIGASHTRDVLPGEIICLNDSGVKSVCVVDNVKVAAFCIFEYVYFARADSLFEGQLIHSARKECGRQLAVESAVEADIVSTIPDSATPAAKGYSERSGIPYDDVVVKNRYIARTFIQPTSALRKRGVTTKFGPLSDNIKGKRIVLIDDSIVRGNTMPHIVELLRSAGAKEIHIRIASPPLKHPCFMGINIPTEDELIANKYNAVSLAKHFDADSLVYLSVEGLQKAVKKGINMKRAPGYCTACLTGRYPVELEW